MKNSTSITIEKQKFESIDFLRGIAILMVMLVHVSQKVQGSTLLFTLSRYCQMGVQLFFIASAFTLCYSSDIRDKSSSTMEFYIRRLFRIAPGYYIGILIYLVLQFILASYNITSPWQGIYTPFNIVINILFLNGLFPQANNNIVPGGWSIGTEMLFYLVFPLIFRLYKILTAKSKWIYLTLPFISLAFSFSIQYFYLLKTHDSSYFNNNSFIYFNIINQLPVFVTGMSLYFAFKDGLIKSTKLSRNFLFFTLLTLANMYLFFSGTRLFPLIYAITPFIAGLSFIFLFAVFQHNSGIRFKIIKSIGIRSYSCYLLHIIFAYYLTEFISGKLTFLHGSIGLVVLYFFTLVLTYYFAGIMYKYIELNGVKLGKYIINFIKKNNKVNIFINDCSVE